MATYYVVTAERQPRIWENARRLSWVLAAAAGLLASSILYFEAKARDMRTDLDRMGRERLYLERVTRDFERVLDDVAVAAVTNGSLRVLLNQSGFQLKLTSAGSVPAPGQAP